MKLLAELSLPAVFENLNQLKETVLSAAKLVGVAENQINRVELAAEEALLNVMNYAYPGTVGDVSVECFLSETGTAVVRIIDSGIPFDPTSAPVGDHSLPIEDRPIGGLGLTLLRQSTDHLTYARRSNQNILTLEFTLERFLPL